MWGVVAFVLKQMEFIRSESEAMEDQNIPAEKQVSEIYLCVNKPRPRPTFNNLRLNRFNQSLSR